MDSGVVRESCISWKYGKAKNVQNESSPSKYFIRQRQPGKPLIKIALLIIFLALALGLSYTGFFSAKERAYTETLNLSAGENASFKWAPENPGNLTSFRISGSIKGNGTARVYLKAREKDYLVLDSSRLEILNFTAEEVPLTGLIAGENETGIENDSEMPEANLTNESIEVLLENQTELIQENISIPEETVLEDTSQGQENASLPSGIQGNETAPENASQEISSEENITSQENESVQQMEAVTVYHFSESCLETCSLDLSENEYALLIEVESGTSVRIDNLAYTIAEERENRPPELLKSMPDMEIYPGASASINLSGYFYDPDGDSLEFSFIAEEQLTVSIDSGIATITADPNFEGDSKLTFLASDLREKTAGNEITILIRRFNRPPEGQVPNQILEVNSSLKIKLSGYFSDPDGDVLSYSVLPNENLLLGLSGSELSVSSVGQAGLFTVIVNASDGRDFMLSQFEVEVYPTREENLTQEKEGLEKRFGIKVRRMEKLGIKHEMELEAGGSYVKLRGLSNLSGIRELRISKVEKARVGGKQAKLGTGIFAADIQGIDSAEITLEKTGPVNAILECPDYDFGSETCPEWVLSGIPFTDNGTHITFTVSGFSGYTGADITIINVQSYPTVGGNWTVAFNATGYADLTITAVQGTEWSDLSEDYDLRFLEIKCGNQTLNYTWIDNGPGNGSVFVENYYCSEEGSEVSKVLTGGAHTLEFRFGEDVEFAYNFATYTCNSCTICSNYLQNGSMSDGDVLQLTTSVSSTGDCISFGGKDNIIFDCQGYTIDGDESGTDYGIDMARTTGANNNTIRNCTTTDFAYGVYLSSSNNNTFTNLTVTSTSTGNGIYLYGSDYNNFTHVTANSNGYHGISLGTGSDRNSFFNVTASSNSQSGFYIGESSNNAVENVTATENSQYDIYVYATSTSHCSNAFSNITVSGSYPFKYYNSSVDLSNETLSELILCDADNSNVTNITIIGSTSIKNNAILVMVTDYSNFTNINSSYREDGFLFEKSSNNILVNITVNYNDNNGIIIQETSVKNTLINATANSNYDGIYLYSSSNNTFTNVTVSGNQRGIYFDLSDYNTVNDSRIESNSVYGTYFEGNDGLFGCDDYARYNRLYNNYFNNSANIAGDSDGCGTPNYLNITNTTGPNIINGSYKGGNYWTSPTHNNFSDTCADSDSNGFCDSSYTVTNVGTDELPLAPEKDPPSLWFVSPTLGNLSTTPNDWIFLNVSGDESLGACKVDWNNGTWTKVSMTATGSYCYRNMTGLANGSYYFRVYGNDTYWNVNVTEDRQIAVDLPPDMWFNSDH